MGVFISYIQRLYFQLSFSPALTCFRDHIFILTNLEDQVHV